MNGTNKYLVSIICCILLTACSREHREYEETPVELRHHNIVSENDLYIVQNGDTIGSIATAYGVTRGELIRKNNLLPPYSLHIGQRIVVPCKPSGTNFTQSQRVSQTSVVQNSNVSIVQKGGLETEYGISSNETVLDKSLQNEPVEQSSNDCLEQSEERTAIELGNTQELVEVDETPISTTTYVWPVANGRSRITKAFDRQSGNILISTPGRTPVKAIADGVVKMAGKSNNEQLVRFGNMIVIQHKELEKVSIYANLIDLKVKAGQRVSAGDHVALVSQSGIRGMTTNPALYFELDKTTNGKKRKPINPCDVLP